MSLFTLSYCRISTHNKKQSCLVRDSSGFIHKLLCRWHLYYSEGTHPNPPGLLKHSSKIYKSTEYHKSSTAFLVVRKVKKRCLTQFGPTGPPPTIPKCTISNTPPGTLENFTPNHICLGRPDGLQHCPLQSHFSLSVLLIHLILTSSRRMSSGSGPSPHPLPPSCSFSHLPPRCRAPSPPSPQQNECYQHTPGVHCSHFWWHPASGG